MMLSVLRLQTPARVKVQVTYRVAAKAIDFVIVAAAAAVLPYPLGPLMGFAYSVCADGIRWGPFEAQSLGKRIMRLQVVRTKSQEPARLVDSLYRNAPVGVATFFALIPVWGWLILVLVGVPLLLMEIYLMLTVDGGHRLGDVMGDTEVIRRRRS